MNNVNLIKKCKKRNELSLLYNITKIVAETDSIGESYSYCNDYNKRKFQKELEEEIAEKNCYYSWLGLAGLPIYELFINHSRKENN